MSDELSEISHYMEKCSKLSAERDEWKSAHDNLAMQLSCANDDLEIAVTALVKVDNWAKAYPLDVFPEPDWQKAKKLLGSNLLSCISASNMRHVIKGVKDIVTNALAAIEKVGKPG